MKISDKVTGLFLVLLGAAAFYGGSLFPPVPGQQVGPSVFPMVIGGGLVLLGLMIIFHIGHSFEAEAEAEIIARYGQETEEEAYSRKRRWMVLVPPSLLVFYFFASEWLGFVPTAAIMIAALAYAFNAPKRWIIPVAIIGAMVIHLVFLKLLRVPLAPGLLPMPW